MVVVLLCCGLRHAEVAALSLQDMQQREEHRVFADLIGKGGHVRTVPVPFWIAIALGTWMADAKNTDGPLFRAITLSYPLCPRDESVPSPETLIDQAVLPEGQFASWPWTGRNADPGNGPALESGPCGANGSIVSRAGTVRKNMG
jgi:hypothetical protein